MNLQNTNWLVDANKVPNVNEALLSNNTFLVKKSRSAYPIHFIELDHHQTSLR